MSLGDCRFSAEISALESMKEAAVVQPGGDGSAGKSMNTRIWISSTHLSTRRVWWSICNPSAGEEEAEDPPEQASELQSAEECLGSPYRS